MDQSPAATALLVAVNVVRGQWALISAVKNGITENAAEYLNAGFPINTKDNEGMSLLHLAAQGGHAATVRLLIRRGCHLDSVDRKGLTPLHWAATMGQTEAVQELIRRGAAKSVLAGSCGTALHQAALEGHVKTVLAMLAEGCPIDAVDSDGSTVLHLAAQGGHVEMVRELVHRGCDVNTADGDGCTSLHDAADCGKTEAVCKLIELGAKSVVADKFGTPLHRAAFEGHLETLETMLKKGCAFNVVDSIGATVLHYAAEAGHVNVVMELVDRGCHVNAAKANGCTPLHDAAISGRTEAVCKLIDSGATMSVVAGKFGTPLHQAVIKGHIKTVTAMLKYDVCKSILTNHDVAPSRTQVEYGLTGICNSADITPVMSAILYGQVKVLKLLISEGGVNVIRGKDKYSLSAFERCFIGGHASNLSQFCEACGIRSSGEGLKGALATLIDKDLVNAHKVLCLCAISGDCIFLEHQFSKLVASGDYKLPEAVKCVKYFFDVGESVPFLNQLNIPDEELLYPLHISLLSMKCLEMGFAGLSIQNGAKDHTIFITKLLSHPVLKESVNEYFPNGQRPLDLAQQFELHAIVTLIEEAGGHPGVWTGIPPEIENKRHLALLRLAYPALKAIADVGENGPEFLCRLLDSVLRRPSLPNAEQVAYCPGVLDRLWHPEAMIIGANVGAERANHEYKSLMDDKLPLNSVSGVVKRVSMDTCKRAINAMLNSRNGGYVHFGIGDDGKVEEGLNLEQNSAIDRLRRKLGDILKDFSPPVQSHHAEVEPVNLIHKKKPELTNQWRFDIVVKHHSDGVVRLEPHGHAYYRQGPQNIAMTTEMLKQWFGDASVSPMKGSAGDDTKQSCRKDQKDRKARKQGKKRR